MIGSASSSSSSGTAIVVLTRNRREHLLGVLEVLTTWGDVGAVIVVDNASTDDTASAVAHLFPTVDLVTTTENLGATGGRNVGIERAGQLGFAHVFLAEDDTTPNREALDRGLSILAADPAVALVGTRGGVFRYGLVRWGRYREVWPVAVDGDVGRVEECDFVILDGCTARVSALVGVGGLRNDFFIMFEEQELGMRLTDAGWRSVRIEVDVERSHLGAASSSGAFPWRAYYQTRNHLLFCRDRRSLALWCGFAARSAHQVVRESLARKWPSLSLRWRGARDALADRTGPRVLPPA